MPPKRRNGRERPVGMLAPKSKKDNDRSIEKQRKAIEDEYGGPTELLPRAHKGFFASIDASNVDKVPLTGLSQEDLAVICKGDGGRGTTHGREAPQGPARARREPDEAGAKEEKRAKLRRTASSTSSSRPRRPGARRVARALVIRTR